MQKKNAEEILEDLIRHLTDCIEDLIEYKDKTGEEFQYGERTAYTECLECLQVWDKAAKYGLNFDIEKRYPL